MIPLRRWELPNGLVVLFREDAHAPLVALEAIVKTGSATEGAWEGAGISHVVEHMLFKGTATRPVGSIERDIKSYGGQINGHTSYDDTGYTLTIHRDHFAQALELLADALQHPSFDPQELQRELEVVYRELKLRRDDPDQSTNDLVWATRYRTHPYRHPIVGYEPLLKALGRDDLVRYHHQQYLPSRTVLAIVGDVREAEVRAAVARAFGGWRRGVEPSVVVPEEPPVVAPRLVEETADVALAQVVMAFPSVALADADVAALDTLAWIVGEGRGSRLDVALREPGLVHEEASWNYTPRDPGLFGIALRLDAARIPEAVAKVEEIIRAVQHQPVAAAELAAAKRAVTAHYLLSRQTVGAQAGDLAMNEALIGDAEFSRHYVDRVQAVTAEDLQRVARRYLDPSTMTRVIVRPKAAGPSAASVSATAIVAPVELVTLPNGVRVLLRDDPRLPIVTLRVTSRGGLLYETAATNGLSTLAARMLLRGTATRSARELTDLVRSLGGELSSTGGRNSVGVSLILLSQNLARGIEMLSDLWLHPAFPADEFLKEQRLLTADITQAEDEIFPWGTRRLFGALHAGHPYGLSPLGTVESVRQLSVAEVARYHRRLLDPHRTIVSVFGHVRKAEVLPRLERAFGQPMPPTAPSTPAPAGAPLTAPQRIEDTWPRAEAIVLVGFRGARVTDPEVPTLDVMDMVLGGSGGRLFTEVRERQGQAYTVGSYLIHGVDPGSIVLYAVTSPDHAPAVVKSLLAEVDRLRGSVVTPEELAVAKQGMIGAQSIRLQTNGALSLQTSLDELYGLGWRASGEYPQRVQAVTAEEVRRVAQRYLTPEACVVFVGRPRTAAPAAPRQPVEAGASR